MITYVYISAIRGLDAVPMSGSQVIPCFAVGGGKWLFAHVCVVGSPSSSSWCACYAAVPFTDVRFGNAPRVDGDVRLDPIFNSDFSLAKQIAVSHGARLQVTAEVYNAFNRVRFGAPGNQVGSPLFGLVTSQVNQPRAMQFGLRLDF